jgi:DNA repair exonuclease SbcCD ATPase subunit
MRSRASISALSLSTVDLKSARERIHQGLQEDLAGLRRNLDLLRSDVEARNQRIAELERTIGARDGQIAEHLRSIEEWRGQWADITRRLADKEATLAEARASTDAQARELAVRAEQITTLEQDLKEQIDNVHTLEGELTEKSSVLGVLKSEVRAKEDASTRLQAALSEREQRALEAEERINQLRAERAALVSSVGERESTIARLEGEVRSNAVVIDSIQRDIERLGSQGGDDLESTARRTGSLPALSGDPVTRLLIRIDGDTEVVHVLGKKLTSIGRTEDNDLAIDTKFISRHHAQMLAGPNFTVLEDLGSTNGVYVNNRRISKQTLKDGDQVTIGKTRFRFVIRNTPPR